MKLIKPSFEIKYITPNILEVIEEFGRTSYKSEDKINAGSAEKFARMIIKRKHFSVLEAGDMNVKFYANRGFSHEQVRHRIVSYNQESTRYCNYSKDRFNKEVSFCDPEYMSLDYLQKELKISNENAWEIIKTWILAYSYAERSYLKMTNLGLPAQLARDVLSIGIKTEINVKTNISEWRHILSLRTSSDAHPIMIEIMGKLLNHLKRTVPVLFDDIN
jgi:thymidylate synthase (FAD)